MQHHATEHEGTECGSAWVSKLLLFDLRQEVAEVGVEGLCAVGSLAEGSCGLPALQCCIPLQGRRTRKEEQTVPVCVLYQA